PSNLLDYPYQKTNTLPPSTETPVIFGGFEKGVLATWGGLRLEASNTAEDCLRTNRTLLVARQTADFGVTQPKAFSTSVGLDLSNFTA
ncbi:MAG: phage major capsid protein, partial [Planctomycetota bacterium]